MGNIHIALIAQPFDTKKTFLTLLSIVGCLQLSLQPFYLKVFCKTCFVKAGNKHNTYYTYTVTFIIKPVRFQLTFLIRLREPTCCPFHCYKFSEFRATMIFHDFGSFAMFDTLVLVLWQISYNLRFYKYVATLIRLTIDYIWAIDITPHD